MKDGKAYYKRLDYLRVISCILVLLYHLNIVKGGFLAVCTFFALSGYLGVISALRDNEFSIKKYYLKRLKKIYLPLLIVVGITIILIRLIPSISLLNLKPESLSVIFGYNNFWQLSANLDYFARHNNSPFMHFWYISILMQFELIFPIIVCLLKKLNNKNRQISTVIVAILSVCSTGYFIWASRSLDIMNVYYNTFARCFSILLGAFFALIHFKYEFRLIKYLSKHSSKIYIFYTLLLILICILVSAESKNYAIYMILSTLISIRIIEYSMIKPRKREKHNKVNELLAKISYEVYLVQYPVLFFIQSIGVNDFFKVLLTIILTFLISFVLNILINIHIKNKILKILKNIVLLAIIISGAFVLITEKDNTQEMKELENLLNENLKIAEEKNNNLSENISENKKESNETNSNIEKEKLTENGKNDDNSENSKEWIVPIESKTENKKDVTEIVRNLPVIGVGDSVMLGAVNGLYKQFTNGSFDGKVSRSLSKGEDILKDLKSKGKLGDTLILALANNGDFLPKINKKLMEIVEDREVFWVNAVKADDPKFNDKFKEFAEDYPNLHIVEWEEASKGHSEYFYADGIHLKGSGVDAYAETIFDAICKVYMEK